MRYEKPKVKMMSFTTNERLASLNEWLQDSGSDYSNAGITTYVIQS